MWKSKKKNKIKNEEEAAAQQQRKQTQTFCTVLGTASSYACAIV